MEIINDLEKYFGSEPLLEALLIEFKYSAKNQELFVVTDVVNWSLKSDRKFQKTIFKNVSRFKRLFGADKDLLSTEFSYHLKKYQGTHVIQSMRILTLEDGCFNLYLYIDNSFGGFEFECKTVEIESKVGCGIQISEQEWTYFDVKTGVEFNFHYPFCNSNG